MCVYGPAKWRAGLYTPFFYVWTVIGGYRTRNEWMRMWQTYMTMKNPHYASFFRRWLQNTQQVNANVTDMYDNEESPLHILLSTHSMWVECFLYMGPYLILALVIDIVSHYCTMPPSLATKLICSNVHSGAAALSAWMMFLCCSSSFTPRKSSFLSNYRLNSKMYSVRWFMLITMPSGLRFQKRFP